MRLSILILLLLTVLVSAQYEYGRRFGRSRGAIRRFCNRLTPNQRRQLRSIVVNPFAIRTQIRRDVREWVEQQDDNVKNAFTEVEKHENVLDIINEEVSTDAVTIHNQDENLIQTWANDSISQ